MKQFIKVVLVFFGILASSETHAQCNVNIVVSSYTVYCGAEVSLTAIAKGVIASEIHFDVCDLDLGWVISVSGNFDDPCGNTFNGTCYLLMDDSITAPRFLESPTIDLTT